MLFLDSKFDECVEEAGASNFFVVIDGALHTPDTARGTILPGVTRDSILTLAKEELGLEVVEAPLRSRQLHAASEAFCCGTGAAVTPVGSVNFEAGDVQAVKFGKAAGPHTKRLAGLLAAIQTGRRPDTRGWVRTACVAPGK